MTTCIKGYHRTICIISRDDGAIFKGHLENLWLEMTVYAHANVWSPEMTRLVKQLMYHLRYHGVHAARLYLYVVCVIYSEYSCLECTNFDSI